MMCLSPACAGPDREVTDELASLFDEVDGVLAAVARKHHHGWLDTLLKNEYGARLISPFALIEVIQPIGRGPTMALWRSCGSPWLRFCG